MRGKAGQRHNSRVDKGITPACAGKSVFFCGVLQGIKDHPRVCGEKFADSDSVPCGIGSPPRVRGKEMDELVQMLTDRITPACAGKRLKRSQYKAIFSIQHRVIPLVLNKVEAP